MDREKILSLAKELGISPEEMLKKLRKKEKTQVFLMKKQQSK